MGIAYSKQHEDEGISCSLQNVRRKIGSEVKSHQDVKLKPPPPRPVHLSCQGSYSLGKGHLTFNVL